MRFLYLTAAVLCVAGSAHGDPANLEGGVFITHHAPSLTYTTDTPEGGWGAVFHASPDSIRGCEDQNTRIDGPVDHAVWFIISAWDQSKDWCTTQVGIGTYDTNVWQFQDNGPLYPDGGSGLEIRTNNFPAPSSGVVFGPENWFWSGNFEPVWWFEGYAYGASYGATVIPLAADPSTEFGGWFNCMNPPAEFGANVFGAMGVNQEGTYACQREESGPEGDGLAACCLAEVCQLMTEEDCEREGGEFLPGLTTCVANPCTTDELLDPRLVWSMKIIRDEPIIVVNAFADPTYGRGFPLPCIRVTKYEDRTPEWPRGVEGRPLIDEYHSETFLEMSSDGMILGRVDYCNGGTDILAMPTKALSALSHSIVTSNDRRTVAGIAANGALVVLNEAGEIQLDLAHPDVEYGPPYLTPSGDVLVFDEYLPPENGVWTNRTFAVNINDGIPHLIGVTEETRTASTLTGGAVPRGVRYFSADGRSAVTTRGGKASFIDFTDPFNPLLLWEYKPAWMIRTAAVSDDGMLIAIDAVEKRMDRRHLGNVLLLNRSGRTVRELLHGIGIGMHGLHFEGSVLFVGFQKHPVPSSVHLFSTTAINAYAFE